MDSNLTMTPPLPMFDDSETAAVNVADPMIACRSMTTHAFANHDGRNVRHDWLVVIVLRASGAIDTIARTQDPERAQWAASRFMARYNEALKETV